MFYTPGPVIYTEAGWYGIKCPGGQMETEREQSSIFYSWSPHAAYSLRHNDRKNATSFQYLSMLQSKPSLQTKLLEVIYRWPSVPSSEDSGSIKASCLRPRHWEAADGFEPTQKSRGREVGEEKFAQVCEPVSHSLWQDLGDAAALEWPHKGQTR